MPKNINRTSNVVSNQGISSISYIHISGLLQCVPGGKINILGGRGIGNSKHKRAYVHVSYSETVSDCTDEQHAMYSHELQSALMLTVEFLQMYYTK
jgi:hypothetical protein